MMSFHGDQREMKKKRPGSSCSLMFVTVENIQSAAAQLLLQMFASDEQSHLQPLLSVALGSVPLDDRLPNVQQKHVAEVEALPAHLHLDH